MPKPIYILNGPNMNLLGVREPGIYGNASLKDIEDRCVERARAVGYDIVMRQTNHEGVLVDEIHEARTEASGVILNAAAYTHTSVAVLDALKALDIPVIECHMSNPHSREPFRHHSYVSRAATAVVAGFGPSSYELALEGLLHLIRDRAERAVVQA
jgi:3-dehydroquinate dehydratase-2